MHFFSIEMEKSVCWEDEDSDEDYVPFLYLRFVLYLQSVIGILQLSAQSITIDDKDTFLLFEQLYWH